MRAIAGLDRVPRRRTLALQAACTGMYMYFWPVVQISVYCRPSCYDYIEALLCNCPERNGRSTQIIILANPE